MDQRAFKALFARVRNVLAEQRLTHDQFLAAFSEQEQSVIFQAIPLLLFTRHITVTLERDAGGESVIYYSLSKPIDEV
ncbi:MAG: hypothetical protein JXB47_10790 [Anaerolineae bacterium]|nr:hypothetical protein [Anaerolineae bacterium]